MALGKLWNTFFGKRTAAELANPSAEAYPNAVPQPTAVASPAAARPASGHPAAAGPEVTAASPPPAPASAPPAASGRRTAAASRRAAAVKAASVAPAADAPSPPQPAPRAVTRRTNAWTPLLGGRQIGTILDTNLGDAARAVEVLQAIADPTAAPPKYVAIDQFDLGNGRLTLMEFHQRIRREGGQPVAIPGDLLSGLRQLSQTLGTVDLVLLDGEQVDLTQLELRRLLARVTHSESLVLQRDSQGRWQPLRVGSPAVAASSASRKAA